MSPGRLALHHNISPSHASVTLLGFGFDFEAPKAVHGLGSDSARLGFKLEGMKIINPKMSYIL
jgi:hypothetical protein